jgi:hypothetical protein
MCYTINRIYRLVQKWPVGRSWQRHIIPPHWMLYGCSAWWNVWGRHQMLAKFQQLFILNTFWHLSYYATQSLTPSSHPLLNFFTIFWWLDISPLPGNLLRLSPFQNLENHHSSPILTHPLIVKYLKLTSIINCNPQTEFIYSSESHSASVKILLPQTTFNSLSTC